METKTPTYLRPKQAAARLQVSIPTFYRWLKRPGFPKLKKVGPHTVLIDTAELDAFVKNSAGV